MTEIRDYAWAVQRRHEECEKVRFWFWLWYVPGEGPKALLKLLEMTDEAIWDQWRDLKTINEIIDHKVEGQYWPGPYEVADAIAKPVMDYVYVYDQPN